MFCEGLLPPQFILSACFRALREPQRVSGLVAAGMGLPNSPHEEESCLLVWAVWPQKERAPGGGAGDFAPVGTVPSLNPDFKQVPVTPGAVTDM